MTTIVRTRVPLETLSMSQPTARRRSKRIAAYEEEDGDFVFTRGAKRTKTAPAEAVSAPVTTTAPVVKRSRKSKEAPKERDEEVAAPVRRPRERKVSLTAPVAESDGLVIPKRRKTTRSSTGKARKEEPSTNPENDDLEAVDLVGRTPTNFATKASGSTPEQNKQSTVISLPFSDTPIINRNKELRKKGGNGTRRSSLGMRGRRASSLIDNGHSALPHPEVATSEFYKHIEAENLSEPRRMKQLLTWTAQRFMPAAPEHGDPDSGPVLAARMTQEGLLDDFNKKSEMSDWFNRESSIPTKVVRKPNPRNLELQENLAAVERRVKILQEEKKQWKALAKPPPALPPLFPQDTTTSTTFDHTYIDASLLDPEQAAILAEVSSTPALSLRADAAARLAALQSGLEFQVDRFADGVHKLEQYQGTIGRVADRVLALCAVRLEERERREREVVGTRDLPMQEVLRSLSRILPKGEGGR